MPVIDALLFCADREEHLRNEVIPAVEQGKVVVSDRYYHSTLAYQQAQGLDLQWLLELNKSFLKPDLTIIIDCEPEACIERIEKNRRMDERKKFETLVFLKKLRKYFLQLPKVLKGEKIVVVDGNRSVEEVYDEVVRLVEAGMQ
jgi:dTMP kinase